MKNKKSIIGIFALVCIIIFLTLTSCNLPTRVEYIGNPEVEEKATEGALTLQALMPGDQEAEVVIAGQDVLDAGLQELPHQLPDRLHRLGEVERRIGGVEHGLPGVRSLAQSDEMLALGALRREQLGGVVEECSRRAGAVETERDQRAVGVLRILAGEFHLARAGVPLRVSHRDAALDQAADPDAF